MLVLAYPSSAKLLDRSDRRKSKGKEEEERIRVWNAVRLREEKKR
jgi:hypothetical protein